MELNLGSVLRCPSGTPATPDRVFEMADIYRLEARQAEVARVNKVTAPELMQAMIDGYGHTSRALQQLEWELNQAEKHAEERKAVVYLEVAPTYLQEKGLVRAANPSGSEDQRRAVLARDKEYLMLSDRVAMIEAACEFLRTKVKQFEMSYQSIKKVYDSLSSVNALTNGANGSGVRAAPYAPELAPVTETNGVAIGKPRY